MRADVGEFRILSGRPHKKLRDFLPDRIAVSHPEVLVKSKETATQAPSATTTSTPNGH